MKDSTKQRLMALFIGAVMLASVAGFAGLQLTGRVSDSGTDQTGPDIPNIVYESLESNEILYVLQTGRVLVQYKYEEGCDTCLTDKGTLEMFARRFSGYVILEALTENTTSLRMTGAGGRIVEIDEISEDSLTDTFCSIAAARPKECLLREFV